MPIDDKKKGGNKTKKIEGSTIPDSYLLLHFSIWTISADLWVVGATFGQG
jgi:hypothetical protein